MIKVMIADDQELIRDSLKIVLDINPDMEVIAVAGNGIEVMKKMEEQPADVILMDVRMPEMDGVLTTKAVKEKYPDTKIIILTTFDDDEYVLNGLKYGASGYLLKGISVPDLSEAIRKVTAGEAMLNKEIITKVVKLFNTVTAEQMINSLQQNNSESPQEKEEKKKGFAIEVDDDGIKELSRNERNIARLVGRGLSNKEIAKELSFSEGTIRNSLSTALSKLNLRDRTQLAIWTVQCGMAGEDME